jgi:hypothetical protein
MKFYIRILIISAILSPVYQAFSQVYPRSRFEVSAGGGWPEMAAVKLKYGENLQVGISQGVIMNTSLEVYYHFAGKSMLTDRKIWYGVAGVERLYWNRGTNWMPFLRFGRELNFARRYGIKIDLGVFYPLEDSDYFSNSVINPSGTIHFFLRI